jgi:hypothetical protein
VPSTIRQLFAAAGLAPEGCVPWSEPVPERRTGVYVVALTSNTDRVAGTLARCPLDQERLHELLVVRPELRVDGDRPSIAELASRLEAFWPPDECVLYIGLAGQPLRKRVGQYRRTPLGADKPHAGGWPLKTLAVLQELWIHWGRTENFAEAEKRMLRAFADQLSPPSRAASHDAERPAPFANLRAHDDTIKRHGITGATGPMIKTSAA